MIRPLQEDGTETGALSDAELVALALARPASYVHVVRRYEGPLLRYVRRMLGGSGDSAEDVVQETFLKAYVNLNDFDRDLPLAPWLYRIAHNESVTYLRKTSSALRVISAVDSSLLVESAAADMPADIALIQQEDASKVCAGLSSMGERYRDVLVLRYLEDKSYRDIGDILRMPPGTVATLIRRGLARLQELLAPDESQQGAVRDE